LLYILFKIVQIINTIYGNVFLCVYKNVYFFTIKFTYFAKMNYYTSQIKLFNM